MISINLNDPKITANEKHELEKLLATQNPNISDNLEQIWYLMDKVWDDMGCDNTNLDWEKIGKYYSHPIWLLNGLFIENHDLSMQTRENIADHISQKGFKHICDYGGGFGTLAKSIAKKCPNSIIYIYEPHPSHYGAECIKEFKNITFINTLQENFYDCVIATDVLEHVEFPLRILQEMIQSTKVEGEVIIANCFYPYIKCHLPHNFHLRYTFDYFAQKMGVKKIGKLPKTHASVFKKTNHSQRFQLKGYHILLSKMVFFCLKGIKLSLNIMRNSMRKKQK